MNPIIENNIIYVPKRATMEDSSILGDGYVPLTDVSEEEQKRWREYMKSNETILSLQKKEKALLEKEIEKQAPPGPPPRPGLQWKSRTHRWIRPKDEEGAGEILYHGGSKISGDVLRRYGKMGQDAGGIFLTPDIDYAKRYSKDGVIYQTKLSEDTKIFDPSDPAHIRELRKGFLKMFDDGEYGTKEDALRDYQYAIKDDLKDWSIGSGYTDAIEAAGFHGARLQERPGTIATLADGSFDISGKPIESVVLFNDVPVAPVEALVEKQAPPGPPPREGLQWKPQTHRWIRPKEIEDQFHHYTNEFLTFDEADDVRDFAKDYDERHGHEMNDNAHTVRFCASIYEHAANDAVVKGERAFGGVHVLRNKEDKIPEAIASTESKIRSDGQSTLEVEGFATHPKNLKFVDHGAAVKGSGSVLMIKLAQKAMDENLDSMTVWALESAIPFYEKIGFVEDEFMREEMDWGDERLPALILDKEGIERLANIFEHEEIEKDDYPDDPLGEDLYDWIDNQLEKAQFQIEGALPWGSKKIGKNVEAELYNSFNGTIDEYIDSLTGAETESQVIRGINDSINIWSQQSMPIANEALRNLFKAGYMAGISSAGGSLGQDFNPQALKIIEDGSYRIGDRILTFGDDATKRFANIITNAYTSEADFSLPAMTKAMKEDVGGHRGSLERIARTETSNISMLGRLAQWINDPDRYVFEYRWNMANDNRTREMKFIRAQGNPYTFDEILFLWTHNKQRLPNGKWQMGIINCRCSVSRSLRKSDFTGNRFAGQEGRYEKTVDFDLDVLDKVVV